MAERMIEANGVALGTESFGNPADPMFPVRHGEVLAQEIPGATRLLLEGAGHGVDGADWETIVAAIFEHPGLGQPG